MLSTFVTLPRTIALPIQYLDGIPTWNDCSLRPHVSEVLDIVGLRPDATRVGRSAGYRRCVRRVAHHFLL